jgi:hypothetical protein
VAGKLRTAATLFALGAVLGTAGDQLHLRSGALSYPPGWPRILGQPLWVPLLFGLTAIVLVLGHAAWLRLGHAPAAGSARSFVASALWFYAAYLSTAVFQETPRILALALAAAWAARVAVAPAVDKAIAGGSYALAGALFECALSATGAFRYRQPDLLLVPLWLPPLYLHVSLMTREAYLLFVAAPRSSARGSAAASSASAEEVRAGE